LPANRPSTANMAKPWRRALMRWRRLLLDVSCA
jgi:hypothetical protein